MRFLLEVFDNFSMLGENFVKALDELYERSGGVF
jgi:hypothetical protein